MLELRGPKTLVKGVLGGCQEQLLGKVGEVETLRVEAETYQGMAWPRGGALRGFSGFE